MRPVAAICRELIPDRRTDGELIAAFISERSEDAFLELVRRHGPLVWGACRRLLPDPADAEDAFQAAFLVLVRRAHRFSREDAIGPWLHRVAVWTARNVRRKNARRLARQHAMPEHVPAAATNADLKADIDNALLALPARYRDSIILCHLQGFTRREAAERLGCAEGTLSAWLNRGLAKLRVRLSGLDPAKVLSVAAVAVPAALSANTARAAAASSVAFATPAVSSIVEGVLHMLWIKKATAATLVMCAVFALGVGIGLGTRTDRAVATAQEKEPLPKLKGEPPADRAKEIAALEAVIRSSEQSHKYALAGADAARKKYELIKDRGNPKEIEEDQKTLARFQQNVDAAAASLKAAKDQLAKLKAAKPEPWFIDLCVGGKEVGIPFEVKEQERNGGPFGSVKIDDTPMLDRHMVRVKRDPNAPPALRLVIWEDAPNDRIKAAFLACQAAGFKEAIVHGKIPTNDPGITFTPPANDPGGKRDGWFQADEVLVKFDELLKPAKK